MIVRCHYSNTAEIMNLTPPDIYTSDILEKRFVARILRELITGTVETTEIELSEILFRTQPGSTLQRALEPGVNLLEGFLEEPELLSIFELQGVSVDSNLYVDSAGFLYLHQHGEWCDLTPFIAGQPQLSQTLNALADLAKLCGGSIYRGTTINLAQWLTYYEFIVPVTRIQLATLTNFMNIDFPDVPATGNFWAPFLDKQHAFLSIKEQRTAIRDATTQFVSGNKLLDILTSAVLGGVPVENIRKSGDQFVNDLLKSPISKIWAQRYIEALGWFGAETPDVAPSDQILEQVLLLAILLDLEPEPEQATSHEVAGYRLYQRGNLNRTLGDVRVAVEDHLAATGIASGNAVSLAAHFLLALSAPEFLVKDLPEVVTVGSVGWVSLRCDVAFIEHCIPGMARVISYETLTRLGELDSVSDQHQQLRELLTIHPILDWASLNGIIDMNTEGEYDEQVFRVAHDHFKRFTDGLQQSVLALTTPAPSRRELTLNAMREILPDGEYLQQDSLQYNSIAAIIELPTVGLGFLHQSMVDFHMSGDLVMDGAFSKKLEVHPRYEIPQEAFSRLGHLPESKMLFDAAFPAYYDSLQDGLLTVLKLAFSAMPDVDRVAFENGYIDVFTVREMARGVIDKINQQETQKQRDDAKGRHGLLLCANYQQQLYCYELFLLQGLCLPRPDLVDLLLSSQIYYENPSLSFTGDRHAFQDKTEHLLWPVDAEAYITGRKPRADTTSWVVVEKLYAWFTTPDEPKIYGPVQTFFSQRITRFAKNLLEYYPIATRQQLYDAGYGATELETLRAKDALQREAIVNILVPFKQCIADLSSGDPERLNEGIGGCVLDSLAIVGAVIGVGSKVTGIAAKSTSAAAKIVSIAKVGASAAVSLFNPVDGLPSMLAGGHKLARKGVLLFSKHGAASLESAIRHLRRITLPTQSYDLFKAASRADILRGPVKTANGDAVNIVAIQHRDDWYSLDLKTGRPWGPRLTGLHLADFNPIKALRRLMPNSYARNYVGKSLPIVRSKIDTALRQLNHYDDAELRTLFKCVFGDESRETFDYFRTGLQQMENDMLSVTLNNLLFESAKDGDALAGLYPKRYKSWKATRTASAAKKKFVVIHSDGMNEFYHAANYDDGRVADALIHEMSHGAPDNLDFMYADLHPTGGAIGDVDVAPLLSLGNSPGKVDPFGPLSNADAFKEFSTGKADRPKIVQKNPALLNADSHALMTSMLNQRHVDNENFQRNLAAMSRALNDSGDGLLNGPVIVNLSTPRKIKFH